MSWIDAAILLIFALYALSAGFRARRQASSNLEEYFLAGRSLSGWRAGISMAATQFAADTPLLVTGLVATAGIFSLWRLWIYALAFLLLGLVLAPSWRRARVLTDAELSELRYAGRAAAWLRGAKALYFGTIFNCVVLAMVLFAAKEVAEPFLLWDQWLSPTLFEPVESLVRSVGVPFARAGTPGGDEAGLWTRSASNLISVFLLVAVTLLYSTTGGLRSVVRTDLAQFALMMGATAGYAIWVLKQAGGMDGVVSAIRDAGGSGGLSADEVLAFTPSGAHDAGFVVLAVYALQWLVQMNADGTGYLAQRTMACRSDRDAKLASLVFSGAQVLLRSLLWLPIALGLLVLFPADASLGGEALRADREASFVRGIEALPPGLRGLMFTAMLAALASTIDSHLNWGASYWTHDLYERFLCRGWLGRQPSPRSLVRVARLSTIGILVLALGIMTQLSSIQSAWQASLLLGSGMGVVLVLRWLWWRVSARGELAAILASSLLAPLLLIVLPASSAGDEALRLLCMAIGASSVGLAVSLAFGPEPASQLALFYARARPPGFWRPVAVAGGADPGADRRRLLRALAAMALASFSLFCLLTGLGSWLARSPAPGFFAYPAAVWNFALIGVGLALAPAWWRLAMSERDPIEDSDRGDRDNRLVTP